MELELNVYNYILLFIIFTLVNFYRQVSFGESPPKLISSQPLLSKYVNNSNENRDGLKKSNCKVSGLKRTSSLPSNQPTLLGKFGFQKR